MLYYPSIYDLMWFVSRTANLLNSNNQTVAYPILEDVGQMFTNVMRTNGTDVLLSNAVTEGSYTYWDDFVGDNGKSSLDIIVGTLSDNLIVRYNIRRKTSRQRRRSFVHDRSSC